MSVISRFDPARVYRSRLAFARTAAIRVSNLTLAPRINLSTRDPLLLTIQRIIIGPEIKKLSRVMETASRGSFIRMKLDYRPAWIPISHYEEKEVQTNVTCDHCGLDFAIFGVFATCPDCGRLNALRVFTESLRAVIKRLALLDTPHGAELAEEILDDALDGAVSAFDGVGKEIARRYPHMLALRPRNLFQNLPALGIALEDAIGSNLQEILGKEQHDFLVRMFNVRHIYEHNMGVIDDDFIRRVPRAAHLIGQKYELRRAEVEEFLEAIAGVPDILLRRLEEADET